MIQNRSVVSSQSYPIHQKLLLFGLGRQFMMEKFSALFRYRHYSFHLVFFMPLKIFSRKFDVQHPLLRNGEVVDSLMRRSPEMSKNVI